MFIIIELQYTGETLTVVTPATYSNRNDAEAAYHTALAAAAVSAVSVHSVTMLDEYGDQLKKESFYH